MTSQNMLCSKFHSQMVLISFSCHRRAGTHNSAPRKVTPAILHGDVSPLRSSYTELYPQRRGRTTAPWTAAFSAAWSSAFIWAICFFAPKSCFDSCPIESVAPDAICSDLRTTTLRKAQLLYRKNNYLIEFENISCT